MPNFAKDKTFHAMKLSFAEITGLIRETIHKVDPTAKVILYGSRARGDAKEDSDWDVLTIIDKRKVTEEDKEHMSYSLWLKGLEIGEEINNFIYTTTMWDNNISMFKHHVMQEGIIL